MEIVSWLTSKYILQVTNVFDVDKNVFGGLLTMYGAADDENKDELLTDLSVFCSHMTIAYIVGGYLPPLSIIVEHRLHCRWIVTWLRRLGMR